MSPIQCGHLCAEFLCPFDTHVSLTEIYNSQRIMAPFPYCLRQNAGWQRLLEIQHEYWYVLGVCGMDDNLRLCEKSRGSDCD